MRNRLIVTAVCAAAVLAFGAVATAHDGEDRDGAFATLVIAGPLLDQGVSPGPVVPADGSTWREALDTVSVYADGELCTARDLEDEGGDAEFHLGEPGQPAACSTVGAAITWRTDALPDQDMDQRWTLAEHGLMSVNSLSPLLPEGDVHTGEESARIIIPGELLAAPIPDRGGPLWWQLLFGVAVYADGERCVIADVVGATSGQDFTYDFTIGGPSGPEACSRPGARITFAGFKNGQEPFPLDATFVLADEFQTFTLDSFAPYPPPLGEPAELAPGESFATVVIPKERLDAGVLDRPGTDQGGRLQSVAVYANGEQCGTIDTVARQPQDAEGNAILALGTGGQPDACRTPGALITFRQAQYPDMNTGLMLFVDQGDTLFYNDFTGPVDDPPITGGPGTTPAPPVVGTGLARESSPWVPWLALAGVLFAAVSLGAFWQARRAR